MSDSKEYVSNQEEKGSINISEEVVAIIAALAASEVDGVSGLSANISTDIAELLGRKNLSKGIKIQIEDNVVLVEAFVIVKYGYTIPEVAKNVQDAIATAIGDMTGLTMGAINVHVGGISFDREAKKRQEDR